MLLEPVTLQGGSLQKGGGLCLAFGYPVLDVVPSQKRISGHTEVETKKFFSKAKQRKDR
jgi:hypothetical protein